MVSDGLHGNVSRFLVGALLQDNGMGIRGFRVGWPAGHLSRATSTNQPIAGRGRWVGQASVPSSLAALSGPHIHGPRRPTKIEVQRARVSTTTLLFEPQQKSSLMLVERAKFLRHLPRPVQSAAEVLGLRRYRRAIRSPLTEG